jgi:hypothetical protein
MYKSPSTDEIPAEGTQAGHKKLRFETYKRI